MIQYPFEVKYFRTPGGYNIAYADEGSGPQTLLFIHGLANYLPVFKHNIQELSKTFRCVAIDLPGNGLSDKSDFPGTLVFYSEAVNQVITGLNLSNVTLVGHSMGGHISMMLALRYPSQIERLVLLASSGLEPFKSWEAGMMVSMMSLGEIMYGDAMSLEAAINNSYYHDVKKDARHIIKDLLQILQGQDGKHWRNLVKSNIESMLNEPVFPFLQQIHHKTLILFGRNDAFIPNRVLHVTETVESVVLKAASLMPQAQYKIFPHCGHFVQIEAAEKVNQEIRRFLSDL